MKIAILNKIARQVEGEFVFISVIKASKNANDLRKFLGENTLPRTEDINGVPCVVEYGIIEDIEIED